MSVYNVKKSRRNKSKMALPVISRGRGETLSVARTFIEPDKWRLSKNAHSTK